MTITIKDIMQTAFPIGYTGSQGQQGTQGLTGYTGSQGVIGNTGDTGLTGYTGSRGDTGSQGIQGLTGYVGSRGITADQGLNTTDSPSFVAVNAASYNLSGNTFVTTTGVTATIHKSMVPDTNAAYDLGSPSNKWRSLYVTSSTIYIDDVAVGVSQGQLTVNNTSIGYGYTGSQGYTGSIGYTGSQGIQGETGFTGSTGSQGLQGLQGYTGSAGEQGVTGYTGSTGSQGPAGADGNANADQDLFTTSTVAFNQVRAEFGSAGGYTFTPDNANDTGMFADADGHLQFISNNVVAFETIPSSYDVLKKDTHFLNDIFVTNTASVTTIKFADDTEMTTAASNATPGQTSVYTRSTLPTGVIGLTITISDSGTDENSPAGNYALAYWDADTTTWLYVANSNSVTIAV